MTERTLGMNLPLSYKPLEYDDWGQIRDALGKLVCEAKDSAAYKDFDLHRRNGTDPYERHGRILVKAVNNYENLHIALKDINWKSADKDNMEFVGFITYSQMAMINALLKTLED